MCDEGRFGFKYIHSPERLTRPAMKAAKLAGNGDGAVALDWPAILDRVRTHFARQAAENADGVVGIFSPWMTCEEAYLLAAWLRSLSPGVRLVVGPVQVIGEDDLYPKNWRGEPELPPRFVIRAEKCPNRKGVEAVLRHFQPQELTFDDVIGGPVSAAYVSHPGPAGWLSSEQMQTLADVPFLVVQDILKSELSDAAAVVLPGASFAEKDGTFINYAGLAQTIKRSILCPAEGYTDGRILMELARRTGLFNARVIRQEMSRQIPYFAPLAQSDLGDHGVRLDQVESAAPRQEQLAR
jgi:NADH-quinone oxidoreductase subunit G